LLHAHYGASSLLRGLCHPAPSQSGAGLPTFLRITFQPSCHQSPPGPPLSLSHATPQLSGLPARAGLGFTTLRQARRSRWPNRVHFRCGLVVLLLLLPTPHRCGAVTFRFGPESVCPEGTCTPLMTRHQWRTEVRATRGLT